MPTGSSYPCFYGLQPRWFSFDRLYKLYLTPSVLCGAWIAGQVYDEDSGSRQLVLPAGAFGALFIPMIKRKVQQRREREQQYDGIDPLGPEFLELDRRNFRMGAEEIQRVAISDQRSLMWAPNSCGAVEFHGWDGKKRKFILVGQQPIEPIREQLGRLVPNVEGG